MLDTLKKKFEAFISKLSPEQQTAMLEDLEQESATEEALGPSALVAENDEDFEIRHQQVYDHVTGTESFQPVLVRKADVSPTAGIGPAALR